MPIKAQGGTADFRLDSRNASGDYADPTNLSLTLKSSLGAAQAGFPVAYPGVVVKDAVGRYHYDWTIPDVFPLGDYVAFWEGILLGTPSSAQEAWEVVPAGSMTTNGFDFLVKPDDYDSIRGLLGVTTLDVEDKDIELMSFGPLAEMEIRRRISNWAEQITDPDSLFIIRTAAIYKTACLMARSFVRGGTIGLARPLSTGEGRDWNGAAEQFCSQFEYWINIAGMDDTEANNGADFDVKPLFVDGPTSTRIARRRSRGRTTDPTTASFYSYPPYWR